MPIYEFVCRSCEATFDKRLPVSQYNDPQVCDACGSGETYRAVSMPSFNLTGDSWPSKNYRIQKQMENKNQRLSVKSRERSREAPGMTLAPNVDGERVDSWEDAKKLAASKGKVTSTYDPHINKENSLKK